MKFFHRFFSLTETPRLLSFCIVITGMMVVGMFNSVFFLVPSEIPVQPNTNYVLEDNELIFWATMFVPVVLGILVVGLDLLIDRTVRKVTRGEVEMRKIIGKYFAPSGKKREIHMAWPDTHKDALRYAQPKAYPVVGMACLMLWIPWLIGLLMYTLFLSFGMSFVITIVTILGIILLYNALVYMSRMAWDVNRKLKNHVVDPDAHSKSE